jgi:multiple sugar transport system substrate-binding protein
VTDSRKDVQTTLFGKTITRRRLVQSAAVAGAAASTAFHAPAVLGQEKAKVTFWTTHSDIDLQSLTTIAEAFNAQSQDAAVEVVQRPAADVEDSSGLITAVRGGSGPDVYLLDRFIVAERAAQGLLQDLNQLASDNGMDPSLEGVYVPFASAEAHYNNSLFALPFDTDVRALYYNKKMLTDAGIDLEAWDPKNGVLTWDAVKEAAAKLDVKDGDNFSTVGFIPYYNQGWHYTFGFSWGGEFFDYDKCEVTPDNPKVLEAMQWVYDYTKGEGADAMYAFIQGAMRPGAPPTDSPWNQNRLAIVITGDWEINNIPKYNPDLDYGITYLPVPTEGMDSSTWAGGWSMVIPQGAKEPEAAFKFMQYACGADGQRQYVKDTAHTPTIIELQSEADLFDERHKFFIDELLPTAKNRPPLPVGAKYWAEMTSAWEKIYLNLADPATAMGEAKKNTQADLDSGGFCPVAKPAS